MFSKISWATQILRLPLLRKPSIDCDLHTNMRNKKKKIEITPLMEISVYKTYRSYKIKSNFYNTV